MWTVERCKLAQHFGTGEHVPFIVATCRAISCNALLADQNSHVDSEIVRSVSTTRLLVFGPRYENQYAFPRCWDALLLNIGSCRDHVSHPIPRSTSVTAMVLTETGTARHAVARKPKGKLQTASLFLVSCGLSGCLLSHLDPRP